MSGSHNATIKADNKAAIKAANKAKEQVTQVLAAIARGEDGARRQLWAAVYDDLRRQAYRQMAGEAPGRTPQPTALVNEVYMRLLGRNGANFSSRKEFFSAAARAMRCILVEEARKRGRIKRGGGRRVSELRSPPGVWEPNPAEVLAVHEALDRLEREEPRKAEVVMLRYFGGLTVEETAAAMGVSRRTVQLDWKIARAWLHRELSGEPRTNETLDDDGTGG